MKQISLKEKYNKEEAPQLRERLGYKNKMAVPKIVKITVNTSFGKNVVNKGSGEREKVYTAVMNDLALITGQKPKLVKSRKSIAGFKLREGLEIASMVTLRKERMWDFLERLIYLSFPRSRDFKGVDTKSVDKMGNLNIGFKEHINFPEIFTEKEKTIFGLEISITTDAKDREKGLELFKLLGFPLKEVK